MNVLLKDFQSNKLRNLALMKLSTYHKGMGDHVFLNNVPAGTRVDKVYVSVVFDADLADVRLHHFARWVNGYFFKKIDFDEYIPWIVSQRATRQTSLSLVG